MTPSRTGLLAIFIAASALASACYSPTVGNGQLACSSDQSCPDGFQCASNGYCYQNGAAVPPDAPTQVTAVPGVRSAQISWNASAHDGGSAITSYTVTASPGGATAMTTSADTSASLSGLQNGTAYTFTVVATNAIGNSSPSASSSPITTFDFPGVPTNVTASAISLGASIDWDAPNDPGGTPVTGYIVQASLNGGDFTHVSPSFSGTHATLTGLAAGGSYTFVVAAVNAVGAGGFSSASSALVLASVPAMPVITAPATVSSGDGGIAASVTANPGETYAWTIVGGTLTNPDGAQGEIANGVDSITFTVTAASGGQVVLGCIATNAVGSSDAATFTENVTGAPVQPTIVAANNVTVGDTGITAQVTANAGMTYTWTLSSNVVLRNSDLHGVTANGVNVITYDLGGSVAAGDTVQLSVVEVNASQQTSAPGTKTQNVVAAPATPTVTGPTAVAAGETGVAASVVARAGMTYTWTLTSASFSSGSSSAGTTSGNTNSILFDVTATTGNVGLSVVETNAAQKSSAPGTLSVPIGALPSPLTIGVALDNGASPAQFQSGATQYVTAAATAVQAQVASVPNATYAWSIVSGGAVLHSGETGTSSTFQFDVTGTVGDVSTGTIALHCTVSIGPASVSASQTVTLVAAPVAPALSIANSGSAITLPAGTTGGRAVAIVSPVSTSTYVWSATPAVDVASIGASGTSVQIALSASAPSGDVVTIHAVETNAAGHVGATAGAATITLVPLLLTPTITPSNTAVADGLTYTASLGVPATGVTYQWSIEVVISSVSQGSNACLAEANGPTACVDNGDGTISFTPSGLQVGQAAVVIHLAAQGSGQSTTATPVSLPVIALPVATISFGPSPTGDSFGANITAGGTREAFVTQSATTYAWSVSPGSISSGGSTNDVIFSAPAGAANTTLALTLTTTNAAGSSVANATVNVVAAPSTPTLTVSPYATNPSVGTFGTRQFTATATPGANAGTSYAWQVSGGGTCVSGNSSICGITPVSGANLSSASFSYTVNAPLGTTLTFSATAVDAAGDASGPSSSATQTVVAAPIAPTINPAFTIEGAPSGTTFSDFASNTSYGLAIQPLTVRAGMSYLWSIGGVPCPGSAPTRAPAGRSPERIADCFDTSGDGTYRTITFTTGTLTTGAQIPVTVTEVNLADDSATSVPLQVNVIDAPSSDLSIVLLDHTGAVLDGSDRQKAVTEGLQATAYVDADPSQTDSFAWTATNSLDGSSALASSPGSGGTAGTSPGSDGEPINSTQVLAPTYASGATIAIGVSVCNAAACVSPTSVSLAVEPTPTVPSITVSALAADTRSPQALTYGASVVGNFAGGTNADGSAMYVFCHSSDANSSIDPSSIDYASTDSFTLVIASAPTSVDGTGNINTTIVCATSNDANDSASSQLIIPLAPPLTATVTPANGSTNVSASAVLSILFSYAPDASTVTGSDPACGGTLTLIGGSTCYPGSVAQDPNNAAHFTFTPQSALTAGAAYTFTVGGGTGVLDLQGVAMPSAVVSSFSVAAAASIPDIAAGSIAATPHLQSVDLAWTNPTDPNFDHVRIAAQDTGNQFPPIVVDASTGAASGTVGTLLPMTAYTITLQVANDAGDTQLSAGVNVSSTTAFSGIETDFLANQSVGGLGASFNGSSATTFSLTWDANNLYLGMQQADGNPKALRNSGDALWVAVDVNGAGADTNGQSSSVIGGNSSSSNVPRQIIWPFNADYVIELSLGDDSTTVTASVQSYFDNSLTTLSSPVMFNGTVAELMIPAASLGLGSNNARSPKPKIKPDEPISSGPRVAMAFLNADGGNNGNVIDIAPPGYSASTADGHTPATDVLGNLASITNSIDTHGHAFNPAYTQVSLSTSTRSPAPALVTVSFDATAQSFPSTDHVQLFGSLPPLSYTTTDSKYALADDGTRGSANTAGLYTGVFNFGIVAAEVAGTKTNELFFKLADNGSAAEPKFQAGGTDRVWTLSGSTETIGDGTNPLVFNQVFSATHDFTLNLSVANITSFSTAAVIGDRSELGNWANPAFDGSGNVQAGVGLTYDGVSAWNGSVSLSNHDFVTGAGGCNNSAGTPDPEGCPLNFKAVGANGSSSQSYEPNGNHSLNDDIINSRQLSWSWGDSSTF